MDFWELLKVLARRWRVVVPIVVGSLVVAVILSERVQPTYEATASVILLSPTDRDLAQDNAFVAVGLSTTAEALAIGAQDLRTQAAIRDAGGSDTYTVSSVRRSPIVRLDAGGDTPAQAVETVTLLQGQLERQLAERQDAVLAPVGARIRLQDLSPDVGATPVFKGAQRVRILVLAVGLGLAAMVAMLLEGLAVLRRRRAGVRVATNWHQLPVEERSQLLAARLQLLDDREDVLREREQLLNPPQPSRNVDAALPASTGLVHMANGSSVIAEREPQADVGPAPRAGGHAAAKGRRFKSPPAATRPSATSAPNTGKRSALDEMYAAQSAPSDTTS